MTSRPGPRGPSLLLALSACLLLALPAAGDRSPWDGARVGQLAAELAVQAHTLSDQLQEASQQARAAADTADLEPHAGVRTVVIQDLAVLSSRADAYEAAVKAGQGRDATRALFGRIESLTSLAASDMRHLPDFSAYSAGLEGLVKTVDALGLFYAESVKVTPPPDPLKEMKY